MTDNSPSIAPDQPEDPLLEIIAHLGAALIQSQPTDDPIIIGHVRRAHNLAVDCRREASRAATLKEQVMRRSSWTPSIVPNDNDKTIYLVVDDFGRDGLSFHETKLDRTDLESVITDLMAGQYENPNRVVAFNTAERWANDVSEDIAREIRRRADVAYEDVSSIIEDFVTRHAGNERQLALRLA